MSKSKDKHVKFDHDAYARSRPANDFWGQIRRTVGGVPVSDQQIKMIIEAIQTNLRLKTIDTLLDIACGNGALSSYLFDSCSSYLGVDLSDHLISVARANFEQLPDYRFKYQGAAEYVKAEASPKRFTKVLCYGSFSYFSESDAYDVLCTLFSKFSNVQSVFIGNLPDKEKAPKFYKKGIDREELLDYQSQIGIWRSRKEFSDLAMSAGWKVSFSTMPLDFYSSYYRYDSLLVR